MILYGILAFIGGCVVLGMADSKKKGPWDAIGSIGVLAGVVMLAIGLLAYPYEWIFGDGVKGIYVHDRGDNYITLALYGNGKAGVLYAGENDNIGAKEGTYEVDKGVVKLVISSSLILKLDILENGDLASSNREMVFKKSTK